MNCPFCHVVAPSGAHLPGCEWRILLQRIEHIEAFLAVKDKETHGSSEIPTQRTGERVCIIDADGKPLRYASDFELSVFARCAGGAHPNASPAEPPGAPPAGAVPAGGEPERSD